MFWLWSIIGSCATLFVDPDTPSWLTTTKSLLNNKEFELVMSDEFEVDGRKFSDGNDPIWTAIDHSDDSMVAIGLGSLQFYNASYAFSEHGYMKIRTTSESTKWKGYNPYKKKYITFNKNFRSAMVSSWNKFCFRGGIIEFAAVMPGKHDTPGLWPALWLLGNLGRPTYELSSNLMWPWSYDEVNCDDLEKRRTDGQFINSCLRTQHYDMQPHHGRGSTEIDLLEVMAGDRKLKIGPSNVRRPYASMTLQIAPGIADNRPPNGALPYAYNWYEGLEVGLNASINVWYYGTKLDKTSSLEAASRRKDEVYQTDAISSMFQLDESHFSPPSHVYRMEWNVGDEVDENGKDIRGSGKNGYIRWYVDDKFVYGVRQDSLEAQGTKIPQEPSQLIINTAISSTWGFPACPENCDCTCFDCFDDKCNCAFPPGFCDMLPTDMLVDWIRVYQDPTLTDDSRLGCDPPDYPSTAWIEGHADYFGGQVFEGYLDRFKSIFSGKIRLLKDVKHGGGLCIGNNDCGTGQCVDGQCVCDAEGRTGPHCLVFTINKSHITSYRELQSKFPSIPRYFGIDTLLSSNISIFFISSLLALIIMLATSVLFGMQRVKSCRI